MSIASPPESESEVGFKKKQWNNTSSLVASITLRKKVGDWRGEAPCLEPWRTLEEGRRWISG